MLLLQQANIHATRLLNYCCTSASNALINHFCVE